MLPQDESSSIFKSRYGLIITSVNMGVGYIKHPLREILDTVSLDSWLYRSGLVECQSHDHFVTCSDGMNQLGNNLKPQRTLKLRICCGKST